MRHLRGFSAIAAGIAALLVCGGAAAQKRGGVLRLYSLDSPGSMLTLEQPTIFAEMPMMGVFNNLLLFDQHSTQDQIEQIKPELATAWSWSEDGTALTFTLRKDVKWHDGRPFTAADVKCSEELRLGIATEKLKLNFQKSALFNLASVTTNGDFEVTFHLKRPQPAFPTVLAGGFAAIFPCHVKLADLRQHPIGTGPFKFVSFQPNEAIKVTRNPDYWNKDRPYLDGIEYTIIKDPATALLAFVTGKVDMTFPYQVTVPQIADVKKQKPEAICELTATDINRHLLVNREKPPFNDPQIRHAMALSIDRPAFIKILTQGTGQIGGILQPPPEGVWGMPLDQLQKLPGYDPDIERNRAEGRAVMEKQGYGPDKRLKIKVTTRNLGAYRDPAVLLIDQLKQVYIDGELDLVDTPQYFPKILRKDYSVSLNLNPGGPDPDIVKLFYGCGSSINWDGYCNPDVDKLIDRQSEERDRQKRKQILYQIEQKLASEDARPIIYYATGGTCRQPYVKGVTVKTDTIFDGWRMEDAWLDK